MAGVDVKGTIDALNFLLTNNFENVISFGNEMEVSDMKNFKENLGHFFDKAVEEPVAITRGNEQFVLMSKSEFLKMKEEIFNLHKCLTSSLQIQSSEDKLKDRLRRVGVNMLKLIDNSPNLHAIKDGVASAYAFAYNTKSEVDMETTTNSRNFRTKLSEFFDKAISKPVAISRGSERFVLMNESEYLDLKDEVLSLQRNLLAMLQKNEGKAKTFGNSDEAINSLFDEIDEERSSNQEQKKVVG